MAKLSSGVGGALVLDAEGLVRLAGGNAVARSYFEDARSARGAIVAAATTLTEILRDRPTDTALHRVLTKMTVVPIDRTIARAAGERLGRSGLSGHRCALDSIVATVALTLRGPVVLLTSDLADMVRLTEEPARPKDERVVVIRV
ncbi:MAG TPA: PIN domain-containing protein [Streptosporangiaceae bacterium]